MSGASQRPLPLGAVLAGGAASRLGGAKATVELSGRPLIYYPLEALAQAGLDSAVVAKAESSIPKLGVELVIEPDEPRHPLAGVIAALRHAGSRGALVVPCDAPFLSPRLLRALAGAEGTTAVRSAERVHPLIAFYPASALDHLESAVKDGASATAALEALEPDWIEAIELETFNVNTPEDLERAEDLIRRSES